MKKLFEKLGRIFARIIASSLVFASLASTIYAAAPNGLSSDADTKFNLIVNTIAAYGFKFGILIIFYGGIQIGLGFKNDNPDGKIQGGKTAVAGLIVAAITGSVSQFF